MQIFRQSEAEITEELDVLCHARQPFLAAYDVRRAHKVVVHSVCKVICRYTVALEQHEILVVFGDLELALDKIGKGRFLFGVAVGKNAQHEPVARGKITLNILYREFAQTSHRRLLLGFGLLGPLA